MEEKTPKWKTLLKNTLVGVYFSQSKERALIAIIWGANAERLCNYFQFSRIQYSMFCLVGSP